MGGQGVEQVMRCYKGGFDDSARHWRTKCEGSYIPKSLHSFVHKL